MTPLHSLHIIILTYVAAAVWEGEGGGRYLLPTKLFVLPVLVRTQRFTRLFAGEIIIPSVGTLHTIPKEDDHCLIETQLHSTQYIPPTYILKCTQGIPQVLIVRNACTYKIQHSVVLLDVLN